MKKISLLMVFFFSFSAFAAPLNKIVIFGDSLSDNGNFYEYMKHQIPISPPYYQGRFSDGPVWIEYLAKHYFPQDTKAHLLDYAFGGAGVSDENGEDDALFTLSKEVDSYLLAHQDKADGDSLFIIWIGANNYLAVPDDVQQMVDDVNRGINTELRRLVDKGAKHILVVNLPDLGKIPAARDFEAEHELTTSSMQHNEKLQQMVSDLKEEYPHVDWIYVNLSEMFNDLLTQPDLYGITNVTDTCFQSALTKPSTRSILKMASTIKPRASNGCEGYLFFDPVHPVAKIHEIFAEKTKLYLDELGVKFAG